MSDPVAADPIEADPITPHTAQNVRAWRSGRRVPDYPPLSKTPHYDGLKDDRRDLVDRLAAQLTGTT